MIKTINQETGYARVNGVDLYYRVTGEGHPLVLIHADIADSRMWDNQVDALAQYYQVITYDMRGFGKTDMPAGDFSHYRDLAGLLEYLVISRAYLLGASMGGLVAINCALEYPEYIDGLILVNSAIEGYTFRDGSTRGQWTEIDQALENGDYELAADLEIQLWLAGPNKSLDQVNSEIGSLVRETLLTTYRIPRDRGRERPFEPSPIERLRDIRIPTLAISGDREAPDFINMSDILAKNVPYAQRKIIRESSHLPNMEKPEEFNEIVLGFLGQLRF
jgi:3-oxoadipate enol-lactonase